VKVLLDACVWSGVGGALAAAGHDVIWAGDWPSDPGDEEILDQAAAEGRVLVTLDKDFGELAVRQGRVHCGIVRLVSLASREQPGVCAQILKAHEKDLSRGAIITAERGRLRVRTP
jgi:predicted nuclease of predicted toxin-antitoxin system